MNRPFDKFSRVSALRAATKRAIPVNAGAAAQAGSLAELWGAECRRNHYGEHLLLRQWYAEPEMCAPQRSAMELLLPVFADRTASQHAADPEKWLFLDTETTGLAGGTGTYAFLVGIAWWEAGGLQVEQFFMRDYTEEHSLLLELAARMTERPVLVTFNGKSFDWPLLETRFRMTRAIAPPTHMAHLDLLHPARQLWRLRLGSVRLSELERNVLALAPPGARTGVPWDRGSDVRSEMIPQIYFDFLRGGSPAPMMDVFRHNQMDLRGLAALAGRILALLEDPEAAEGDAFELYGVSKMVKRRGGDPESPEAARARQLYESAIEAGLPGAIDRAARRELAALAKRAGDFDRATTLWGELIGSGNGQAAGNDGFDAYEQLAIYYERHARQPQRAAELTKEALAELRRAFRTGMVEPARYSRFRERLEHRMKRLERCAERPSLPALL